MIHAATSGVQAHGQWLCVTTTRFGRTFTTENGASPALHWATCGRGTDANTRSRCGIKSNAYAQSTSCNCGTGAALQESCAAKWKTTSPSGTVRREIHAFHRRWRRWRRPHTSSGPSELPHSCATQIRYPFPTYSHTHTHTCEVRISCKGHACWCQADLSEETTDPKRVFAISAW
jgi:hypothetical protein